MKSILIIIAIFLIAGAVGFSFGMFGGDDAVQDEVTPLPTPTPQPPALPGDDVVAPDDGTEDEDVEEEQVTVSMDDTGFSPSTVTVSVGTEVVFVNNGQSLRHPASDPHPTHHLLPEFDARRGIATGQTYSFTFTQTGTFSYHDHLNPSLTGTIVVE